MPQWDYQKSYVSQKANIDNDIYTLNIDIPKNEQLDYIICDFDNGIIKINGAIYKNEKNLNIKDKCVITLIFYEDYLATYPKRYIASAYYFPLCDCCCKDTEIEVESLDNPILPERTKLRYTFTRHYETIPTIMCYFSSGI